MAEAIFKQLSDGKHFVVSAGTEALGYEGKDLDGMPLKDRKSSTNVIEVLKEIGIDVSGNIIKRVTPGMVEIADKIFVMTKPNVTPEFLKNNKRVVYWDIEDPADQTLDAHRKIRDEVGELVKTVVVSIF